MNAVAPIQSRIPYEDYLKLPGLRISTLKEVGRSPKHYQHAIVSPKQSKPLTLGTAAHCAALEPERFARDFVVWSRKTDTGRNAPRNGRAWEDFLASTSGKTVLTAEEASLALAIGQAVRSDPIAAKYLEAGDPEVTLTWRIGGDGRPCKARVDWLTRVDGMPVLVGLKTAREVRHFAFGAAAARYGYHLQWAFYQDGFTEITSVVPRSVEIVVESDPPHAVVVYAIPEDIVQQGRDEYLQHLETLARCERLNEWPGPAECEQVLTLPSWVYGSGDDDVGDLGLEA